MGLHLGSCFSRRRVISMILLGVLCNVGNAQSGTIKGNVFFKYNDLIGNRADAGSQVILYSQADSTFATTTADLQGNFVYDNLQPGQYMVGVVSENTIDNGIESFGLASFAYTQPYLGFSFSKLSPDLYDSIHSGIQKCDSLLIVMSSKTKYGGQWNKARKAREKIMKDCQTMIKRLMAQAPLNSKTLPYNFTRIHGKKYRFSNVTVEPGKTSTIVIDFGITYL